MEPIYKYKWREMGEARYMQETFGIDYCVSLSGKDFNGYTIPAVIYVISDPIVFEVREGDSVRFKKHYAAMRISGGFLIPQFQEITKTLGYFHFAGIGEHFEGEPLNEIIMRGGKPFIMPEEVK